MPTFNGERYISEQLESFANQSWLPDELVICDDGSTDKSLDELHKIEHSNLNILELAKNQGKGKAMRTGLEKAKTISDIVIFTDAEKEILINDIAKIFDYYKNNNVDAVFGSRFLNISI